MSVRSRVTSAHLWHLPLRRWNRTCGSTPLEGRCFHVPGASGSFLVTKVWRYTWGTAVLRGWRTIQTCQSLLTRNKQPRVFPHPCPRGLPLHTRGLFASVRIHCYIHISRDTISTGEGWVQPWAWQPLNLTCTRNSKIWKKSHHMGGREWKMSHDIWTLPNTA